MGMQRISDRFGRRLLWCCTLGALAALGPGAGSVQAADACAQRSAQVPNNPCQNQVQAPISYTGLETNSWAYYCTGDHPYFFKANNGVAWDNTCFTSTENIVAENDNFDGDFTNWCVDSEWLVVTLACFQFNPN